MKFTRRFVSTILIISSLGAVTFFFAGCRGSSEAADNDMPGGVLPRLHSDSKVVIPAGTSIQVRLLDPIGSSRSSAGQTFQATLAEAIVLNGKVVVGRGANVIGRVVSARPSGHLETPAQLAVTLMALQVGEKTYDIETSSHSWSGQSHKGHDAKWIAGSAGAGALLGALVGHGKGAAIGAGVGAGAGTAGAYATGKKDIYLAPETHLNFELRQPVSVTPARTRKTAAAA
jgi:hypothetical protein